MRVQETAWFNWFTIRAWMKKRELAGTKFGATRFARYVALAPAANGQLPLSKLAQTLVWVPSGQFSHLPLINARTSHRAQTTDRTVLKLNLSSAVVLRRTVQNTALQFENWTDVGRGSDALPEYDGKLNSISILYSLGRKKWFDLKFSQGKKGDWATTATNATSKRHTILKNIFAKVYSINV